MKRRLFILLNTVYLLLNTVNSQNLVLNPSFEDTITCPFNVLIDSSCYNWTRPENHTGTPDHFHTCNNSIWGIPNNQVGVQDTCFGNAYAGQIIYHSQQQSSREYLTGELSDTLKSSYCYKISFKYSLGDNWSTYGIKNYGIYFSNDFPNSNSISPSGNLQYQPQIEVNQWMIDDTNWVKIERFYSAKGGEKYITMGNFNDNDNTDTLFYEYNPSILGTLFSYVYIDDVVVEEVPFQNLGELNLGGDTILCTGEQITFNNILPDSTVYVWNQLSNDTAFTIDSSGQYILEAYNGCSYTTDTIHVEFVEPIVELGEDKLVCKREEVVLQTSTQQHPNTEYTWYNQTEQLSTEQQLNITEEGTYSLQVNVNHCTDSDTIEIKYHIPKNSTLITQELDTTFCVSGILDATSTEWNDKYLWNTDEETQTIEVTESGEYSVYTENECTEATSTFNVTVEQLDEGLNDYNIFSPNGDFTNDLFTIYEGNSEEYQINIYNRWGKLLFQSDNPQNHWSAEGINDGSYFYYLSFRNCAGEIVEQKGSVEVKR